MSYEVSSLIARVTKSFNVPIFIPNALQLVYPSKLVAPEYVSTLGILIPFMLEDIVSH